ncbi:hypothetical protein L6261_00230 [Candidatus Parcubacteria bacterium]|nr:hypothetical protein [Candidatus Parcubacteria bacterium]
MTPFFSFLKNKVFQKTKKWCHAREDGFFFEKSVDEMPSSFRLRELRSKTGKCGDPAIVRRYLFF